jgi:hypothetical protein
MTLVDQIRELIAEGETRKSLQELYNYVKENNADVIDRLVLLRNRMENLERAVQSGTIDDREEAIEKAKINEAILKILPQLTPEYIAQASEKVESLVIPEKATPTPARNTRMFYLIGGAVALLVILIMLFNSGGSGAEDQMQEADIAAEEPGAEPGLNPAEGTLLYDVITAHDGYAVWKSVYNEANGQSIFIMESDEVFQEIKDDQVVGTFKIVANSTNYVTMYDSERELMLRIGNTKVQFQKEGEDYWNDLYTGEWVTPADAQ